MRSAVMRTILAAGGGVTSFCSWFKSTAQEGSYACVCLGSLVKRSSQKLAKALMYKTVRRG